ncbi:MAG: CRISPR-associated endoribonuclease Cas6 [Phormidium sp. OSCR]|nr:MAG: CRISPR-associated endoribonuclease Cas6 [Phormidium sp. OSCR]
MLIRSHWNLTPSDTAVLPRNHHLELVKHLHEKLGLEMAGQQTPSLTFSGLVGSATRTSEFVTFHPEHIYRLSLSGLTEPTSKAIFNLDLGDKLEFLGSQFQVGDRHQNITSYDQLYTELIANEPEPNLQFDLSFLTPTSFSQKRIYLPLPLPRLLFQSWLDRWNEFAPVYLGSYDLLDYLEEAIALKYHNIKSCRFPIYRSFATGFLGDITLQIPRRTDPLISQVANLLVHYANFCGTGVKTRLGMGLTDYQVPEQSLDNSTNL